MNMSFSSLLLVNLFNVDLGTLECLITKSILAILTSFFICLFLGPWLICYLFKIHIRQYIREEGPKSHYMKAGTPTMGGILILIPLLIAISIWTSLRNPLILVILFVTISFAVIGFIDDYVMQVNEHSRGLRVKQKFILQILIATVTSYLILLLPGFDTKLVVPFCNGSFLEIGYARIPFSVLIIVGTSNAVNLTDGLDGAAISIVTIAKIVYMLIALTMCCSEIDHVYISDLAVYCAAFIGSGLGFLWFNSHPAQIFMGDTGSLSIGASLGTLSILVKHELLLILVGGILVIETMSVILQVSFFKISNGRRLFKMTPLHHHFELIGISEPKIVSRFCIVSIILAFLSFLGFKTGYIG